MDTKTIWIYTFFLALTNFVICIFIGLSDFIVNKDIIILFLGLACLFIGISDLSSLYDFYITLKKENEVKWLVISEIISEVFHTSRLLRGLGEVVFASLSIPFDRLSSYYKCCL